MKSKQPKKHPNLGIVRIRRDRDGRSWRVETMDWICERVSKSKEGVEEYAKELSKEYGSEYIGEDDECL